MYYMNYMRISNFIPLSTPENYQERNVEDYLNKR